MHVAVCMCCARQYGIGMSMLMVLVMLMFVTVIRVRHGRVHDHDVRAGVARCPHPSSIHAISGKVIGSPQSDSERRADERCNGK